MRPGRATGSVPAMRFATDVTVTGPWRSPAQMLADQVVGDHASVHDEGTAASVGLAGAPIEGPTQFSQFDPLAATVWGQRWFEEGCISSHFRTMVVEGERVRASLTTAGADSATVEAHKDDGAEVLTGTASVGTSGGPTELDRRLASLPEPGELFIVDRLEVGMRSDGGVATMTHDESNGPLYPFSLDGKLARITEPHPWYTEEGGASSPWGAAVVPMEMVSVLAHRGGNDLPVRGPALGLFLDLEIRLVDGPVLVGRPYQVAQEVVGLGQSRRTESYWTRTSLTDVERGTVAAVVLLHSGVFKASYAGYPADRLA